MANQKWARISKSRWRAKWEINLKLFLSGLDLTDDSTLASKMHSNVRISFGEKVTEANTWPWGGMSAFWGSISKMSWIFDELLLFSAFTLKFTSQLFTVFILVPPLDGVFLNGTSKIMVNYVIILSLNHKLHNNYVIALSSNNAWRNNIIIK